MASLISVAELESLGGNPEAIADFTSDQKLAQCAASSAAFEGYARTRYQIPLDPASIDLATKQHIARHGYYGLLSTRGFSPDGNDQVIVDNYNGAIAYFRDVSRGVVVLDVPAPTLATAAPAVYSDESRGW